MKECCCGGPPARGASRRIQLTGGSGLFDVYDTSEPQVRMGERSGLWGEGGGWEASRGHVLTSMAPRGRRWASRTAAGWHLAWVGLGDRHVRARVRHLSPLCHTFSLPPSAIYAFRIYLLCLPLPCPLTLRAGHEPPAGPAPCID